MTKISKNEFLDILEKAKNQFAWNYSILDYKELTLVEWMEQLLILIENKEYED